MDPIRVLPPAQVARARAFAAAGRPPAEPRDAATVVLLRPGQFPAPGALEVYLLRRHTGMAFAPGMWVFPGGGVDPRDAELPASCWSGPPPEEWARRMGCTPARAVALACAAVRETFEESGVLLAGPPGGVVADTRDLEPERVALVSRSLSLAALLTDRGWVLRSDLLAALGAWVTPVFEPRRYRTWFFVAALPAGQLTRDVSSESDQVGWRSLRDAIAAVHAGVAEMLPPTYLTCCELFDCRTPAEALAHAARVPWAVVEPEVDPATETVRLPDRLGSLAREIGPRAGAGSGGGS